MYRNKKTTPRSDIILFNPGVASAPNWHTVLVCSYNQQVQKYETNNIEEQGNFQYNLNCMDAAWPRKAVFRRCLSTTINT